MAGFSSIKDKTHQSTSSFVNKADTAMTRSPNSRDIEAFNVVAVELSFRRAAERLAWTKAPCHAAFVSWKRCWAIS